MNAGEDEIAGRQFDYYLDIRHASTSDKISLDLSRHLPKRAAIGPVAIIADRPLVLLSVVKKRWTRVIHEVERQYASTLDRAKKESLRQELARLRAYRFGANSLKDVPVDILFLASGQLLPDAAYPTIYLTVPIAYENLSGIISHLQPGGVLVIYGDTTDPTPLLEQIRGPA